MDIAQFEDMLAILGIPNLHYQLMNKSVNDVFYLAITAEGLYVIGL